MSSRSRTVARDLTRALASALQALYPRTMRDRFGAQMAADAERMLEVAWDRRGWGAVPTVWARLVRDAAGAVPAAWRRERQWRRDSGGEGRMRGLGAWDDVKWGLRGLRRAPGFTVVTVGVLGLGIAGAAATFGVVDAYLLRGLPYPASERLVGVRPGNAIPYEEADPSVVEEALTWDLDAFTLVGGDGPELVRAAWISPGYIEAFGVEPAMGRAFRPEDYGEGVAPVALLSHGLWQRRYGGDPDILGRSVTLYASDRPDDAEVFTVVGVLPSDFWFHNAYTEMLVPLRTPNPMYMARLRPGVPLEEARRALEATALRLGADLPEEGLRLVPFERMYTEPIRGILAVLATAVALVLGLAVANAAVLILVRASGRAGEFAVRRALGAGRGRIRRQVMAEGLLVAALGAGVGMILAWSVVGVLAGPLQARLGVGIPGGPEALAIDLGVVGMALGITLVAGVGLGLAGVAGAGRVVLRDGLATAGRAGASGRRRRRVQGLLVGTELALSLTLLIGAGLTLRSARHLADLELGIATEGRITAQLNLRAASYPEPEQRVAFYDEVARRAGGIPGVESVGMALRVPFAWNFGASPLEAEGMPAPERVADAPRATGLVVGPGLLDVLDIAVPRGRGLETADGPGADRVAVVGQALAERLWPGRDPIGLRIREAPTRAGADEPDADPPWWTVVGVAEDIRQAMEGEDQPEFYVPYGQVTPTSMTVVLHVREGAAAPIGALEEIVHALDGEVALTTIGSLDEMTSAARAPSRFLAGVMAGFSLFALLLAVLGLYGVVSYAAARRRRDVAVRMALGAEAGRVVAHFLGESLPVLGLGLGAGLVGAALLARALEGQLRGVSPWDPLTWIGVAAALLVAASLAAWWPARRAAAADPAQVLRES